MYLSKHLTIDTWQN